ncbi:hypothetical protein [Bosea sp. BK604]|uniref:head-tail joining protein n=1 Tax=Bosea sp. BK604 TaxID=2512180 RepID=UPI0010480E56|nr:hypothetical protein [Bosea sp. BK604]TCR60946.1 hypothetical protein EV560_115171 [Bosea sp. BK604]
MIDFNALVLGPAMAAFARPITILPAVSQPGEPAYPGRGIWGKRPADFQLEDGSAVGTDVLVIGIRIGEFPILPQPGDQIDIDAYASLPRVGLCEMVDDGDDGQGGYALVVKIVGP